MHSQEKFSFLRSVLRTLGLSADAVDDIVGRIVDFLSEKDEISHDTLTYPYVLRDDFLSAAEYNFYLILKSTVANHAVVCTKVNLGDLFYAKTKDPSEYRTCTNRIDRKHVDFLLCDAKTMHPLLGIELDDKSHRREDRQARDEFVGWVFVAAQLPLLRIPVRPSYAMNELKALLSAHLPMSTLPGAELLVRPTTEAHPGSAVQPVTAQATADLPGGPPCCPKCGGEMVLRTARNGANQGNQFWGCSDYPRCRGILKYEAQVTS